MKCSLFKRPAKCNTCLQYVPNYENIKRQLSIYIVITHSVRKWHKKVSLEFYAKIIKRTPYVSVRLGEGTFFVRTLLHKETILSNFQTLLYITFNSEYILRSIHKVFDQQSKVIDQH